MSAPDNHLALSLAVLGITPDRELTEDAEKLFIRAAGEKVRLQSVVEAGGFQAKRARRYLTMLNDVITEPFDIAVINGAYPHLSSLHNFLTRWSYTIDDVCRLAAYQIVDQSEASRMQGGVS